MTCFLFLVLVLASVALSFTHGSRKAHGNIRTFVADGISRNSTTDRYDYVVVGCGIAGLVVATRLSEDPNISVLCVEAGSLDNGEDLIEYPVFIGEQPLGFYAWELNTVPQTQLDNNTRSIPMGRGVGGGSQINGMIWNRGNQIDFDLWSELGNPGWDWENLLPYFRKSETYTPRTYYGNFQQQPVSFDPAVHGFSGPVCVSYPEYYWPQTVPFGLSSLTSQGNWFEALGTLGIDTCFDPNEGLCAGGYFLPNSIDPTNQTRSDARRAYHDAASQRPNYHILTNTQVGRIIFNESTTISGLGACCGSGTLRAVGVEVPGGPNGTIRTILANREVIIAAGAIHSPQLLELSGIGAANLLSSLDVPILVNLSGVGNNLQDHAIVRLSYPYQNPSVPTPEWLLTNTTFNTSAAAMYLSSRTGPWTSKASTALGFPSLAQVLGTNVDNMTTSQFAAAVSMMIERAEQGGRYYPSMYELDKTLRAGYELQFSLLLQNLLSNDTPAYEILNDNSGGLDLALMHPLSRGTTHITTTDPLADPAVDPRWLVNPFDFDVMLTSMQFNQRILDTPSIQQALQPSYAQISQNCTRDQLSDLLRTGVNTEYHYSGTAAMMPRELGGVVDPNLVVYGTSNLRVVDTSIFPVIPGGHLQAVAYAVAEKGADIIRGIGVNITRDSFDREAP